MAVAADGIPGPGVVVLGAGISGAAAAELLLRLGRDPLVADARVEAEIAAAPRLRRLGARLAAGGHPPSLLDGVSLVVASPGFPPDSAILVRAQEAGIPVWSELELGYRALGEPAARIAAVTGTKGKSSVTTLLAEALRRAGQDAVACGNLGRPLSAVAPGFGPEAVAVIEVSSFQLATIARFRARVAVLLAVAEDHLDWHPDREHYHRSKARIFENQTAGDIAVFDGADPVARSLAETAAGTTGAALLPFGGGAGTADTEVVIERGRAVLRAGGRPEVLARLDVLPFAPLHQQRNLTAAATAARLFGAPRQAVEAAARGFRGLPHAIEDLGGAGGVRFVNDSRATTLVATAAALGALGTPATPAGGIELILGGILKGGSFAELDADLPRRNVRTVHAIGAATSRIVLDIRSVPVRTADSLDQAVRRAFRAAKARGGGIVLLSPGCSSFDLFANYRDRGRRFRTLASGLGARPPAPQPAFGHRGVAP